MILEKCPTSEELRAFSLGQLNEEQSDEMLGHVKKCDECQADLETDSGEDTLIKSLRSGDSDAFAEESDCQVAMAKALGTLAAPEAFDNSELSQLLPKVLGDYEIVRSLGRGGMGNVYLARHQKLGREVALKVLSSHRLLQPRMRQRFETEMRAVGRLSHPNIVTAYDAREVDDLAVLVTEYIDGLDVAQVLRRTGKLSAADACEIARQAADAIGYVNEQGLVHRDIKPSNVMLSRQGDVKLLDLGLARLCIGDDASPDMTATGQAMGTADYIAPEQVNDSRNVDIRADIYALGCTLFKMLSGRAPFGTDQYPTSFAKMTAHVSDAPPRLQDVASDVPRELATLVDQMIAKTPADRPQSPAEIAKRLSRFSKSAALSQLAEDALNRGVVADLSETGDDRIRNVRLAPQSFLSRRVPMTAAIGAGLLGALLGLLLGIVITIKNPDGSENKVDLPPGASAQVAANGDVSVELGAGSDVRLADVAPVTNRKAAAKRNAEGWSDFNKGKNREAELTFREVLKFDPKHEAARNGLGFALLNQSKHEEATPIFTGLVKANPEGAGYVNGLARCYEQAGKLDEAVKTWKTVEKREGPVTALTWGLGRTLVQLGRYDEALPYLQRMKAARPNDLSVDELISKCVNLAADKVVADDKNVAKLIDSGYLLQKRDVGLAEIAFRDALKLDPENETARGGLGNLLLDQGKHEEATPIFKDLVEASPNIGGWVHSLARCFEQAGKLDEAVDTWKIWENDPKKAVTRLTHGLARTLVRLGRYDEAIPHLERIKLAHPDDPTVDRMIEACKSGHGAAEKTQKHLSELALGLLNYESARSSFPSAAKRVKSFGAGPDVSWRVKILPFLEEEDLYNEYQMNQPWDSEKNLRVLEKMPDVFRQSSDPKGTTTTRFLAVAGPKTIVGDAATSMRKILDGTGDTMLLVEAYRAVPWTKPDDISPEELIKWAQSESFRGVNAVFADGMARFLEGEFVKPKNLRALTTIAGGELVDVDQGVFVE